MNRWFRAMNGSVYHFATGYTRSSLGLLMLTTACGKDFFEGDKYLRGVKKECKKCRLYTTKIEKDNK